MASALITYLEDPDDVPKELSVENAWQLDSNDAGTILYVKGTDGAIVAAVPIERVITAVVL